MFKNAYQLIRDILDDDTLNNYILDETGKHLAVINAGAKISAPCVSILLNGGSYSRKSNSGAEVDFLVSFALPFWGAKAFIQCLDFVDLILPVFFDYRGNRDFVLRASPSIQELDAEGSQLWAVNFILTVATYF